MLLHEKLLLRLLLLLERLLLQNGCIVASGRHLFVVVNLACRGVVVVERFAGGCRKCCWGGCFAGCCINISINIVVIIIVDVVDFVVGRSIPTLVVNKVWFERSLGVLLLLISSDSVR